MTMMTKRGGLRAASALLLAALVACGGGGGGGDDGAAVPDGAPGPRADITAAGYAGNGDSVAQTVLGSLDRQPLVASLSLLTSDASATATGAAPIKALGVERLALRSLLARTRSAQAGRVRPLGVDSYSLPCDSGSLSFVDSYASTTTTTVGDTLTVSSNACVADGELVSGTFRLTIAAFSATSSSASARVTLAFSSFGAPSLRLDGSVEVQTRYTATGESLSLQFAGLSATAGGVTVQWYHGVEFGLVYSTGVAHFVFSGFVFAGNGYLELNQRVPFTVSTTTGNLTGGVLRVTGSSGAYVNLVAGSTRLRYDYFAAGNTSSTPTATVLGYLYPV